MIDRETLEKQAKTTVSSDLYYVLCDEIDTVSDAELQALINCNGDYTKEMQVGGYKLCRMCGDFLLASEFEISDEVCNWCDVTIRDAK